MGHTQEMPKRKMSEPSGVGDHSSGLVQPRHLPVFGWTPWCTPQGEVARYSCAVVLGRDPLFHRSATLAVVGDVITAGVQETARLRRAVRVIRVRPEPGASGQALRAWASTRKGAYRVARRASEEACNSDDPFMRSRRSR